MQSQRYSHFVVGFSLFAMFFGSGNLTFPLALGRTITTGFGPVALGFFLSAVFLPFLGTLAVVCEQGRVDRMFRVGSWDWGRVLIPVLLTVWIPLGSGPRCITVAHGALAGYQHGPQLSLALFSLTYSILVLGLVLYRQRLIEVLGLYLAPALLVTLGILIVAATTAGSGPAVTPVIARPAEFTSALLEGYNTMDLIAACFFAASLIKLMAQLKGQTETERLRSFFKAGVVGSSLLGIVYLSMLLLAWIRQADLLGVGKEAMLPALAHSVLGDRWAVCVYVLTFVACLSTSIGLTHVYVEYLREKFPKVAGGWFLLLVTFVNCGMSLFGFEGLSLIYGPLLSVLYPLLIVFVVRSVGRRLLSGGS